MEDFNRYLRYQKELAENKLKAINRFLSAEKPKILNYYRLKSVGSMSTESTFTG